MNEVTIITNFIARTGEVQYKALKEEMEREGIYERKLVRTLNRLVAAGALKKEERNGKMFYRLGELISEDHVAFFQKIILRTKHAVFSSLGSADISVIGLPKSKCCSSPVWDMVEKKAYSCFEDLLDLHTSEGLNPFLCTKLCIFYFMQGLENLLLYHSIYGHFPARVINRLLHALQDELKAIDEECQTTGYTERYIKESFETKNPLSSLLNILNTAKPPSGNYTPQKKNEKHLIPQLALLVTTSMKESEDFLRYPENLVKYYFAIFTKGDLRLDEEIAELVEKTTKSLFYYRRRLHKSDIKRLAALPFLIERYGEEGAKRIAHYLFFINRNYKKILDKEPDIYHYVMEDLAKNPINK